MRSGGEEILRLFCCPLVLRFVILLTAPMNLFSKFPSFDYILKSASATFLRFPFTIISALVGSISAIILVEVQGGHEYDILEKIMVVASLGLPLFTALACYADKKNLRRTESWGIQAIGAVLLIGYYFSLPADLDNPFYHLQRYLLLNICFHFLVAFLPFLGGNQINGFWQFNKSLFIRFLTALLYSTVLYIGLVIALAALDYLFGVDIEELYFDLWIVIVGIFNTWFFLAGVPEKIDSMENETSYPKGLKVFTQYILLPLVALYFVILISYEIKILIQWNWPKGWVSQLVLWYSVVGILSLLLLHPLREQTENKWIKVFSRWFFRVLVPLVAMLFLAILVRVSDYGFTENRYFVLAMALGLSIVVLYFIFSRKKDIRIIPIVICAIALLSAYGPWSAFSVSKKAQQKRLSSYLAETELMLNGKLQTDATNVPDSTAREMSSIVKYLSETHGTDAFSRWLPDSVIQSMDTLSRNDEAKFVCEQMGFKYLPRYGGPGDKQYFNINAAQSELITLSDYDYMIEHNGTAYGINTTKHVVGNDSLIVTYDTATYSFNISLFNKSESTGDIIQFSLVEPISALLKVKATGEFSQEDLTFTVTGKNLSCKIVVNQISGMNAEESPEISFVKALLLIKIE